MMQSTFASATSKPQYKNWLKACLGLCFLKDGLCEYVESEGKAFHIYLTGKLSLSSTTCSVCSSEDIKFNKKKGGWELNCPYIICSKVLDEIIANCSTHHKRIHWTVSNVQKWTTDYWEVLKLYGNFTDYRQSSHPKEIDYSGILSIIVNCEWFNGRISQIHAEQVRMMRNKLYHAPDTLLSSRELELTLADIEALLKSIANRADYPSVEVAVGNIEELKRTEFEITPAKELAVIRSRCDTVYSILENVKQKLDQTQLELMEQREAFQKQLKKADDIQEIQSIQKDVIESVSLLESRFESRLSYIEEQTQEGEVLANLKKKTNDFILTMEHKVPFFRTRQHQLAYTLLRTEGSVVITGSPGEGKTLSSVYLMTSVAHRNRCLRITHPGHWQSEYTSHIDVLCIDDFLALRKSCNYAFNRWLPILQDLQGYVSRRKLKLIILTRSDEYGKHKNVCEEFMDIFHTSVKFCSSNLSIKEKEIILRNNICRGRKSVPENEIIKCCEDFKMNDAFGFPYCCDILISDPYLFEQLNLFFRKPLQVFQQVLQRMATEECDTYLSLAYLFLQGGTLHEEHFKLAVQAEEFAPNVKALTRSLSRKDIKKQLDGLVEQFIDYDDRIYSFATDIVYTAVAAHYARFDPKTVIEKCSMKVLNKICSIKDSDIDEIMRISGHDEYYVTLSTRILKEVVTNKEVSELSSHEGFLHPAFSETFFQILSKSGQTFEFFTATDGADTDGIFLKFVLIQNKDILTTIRLCLLALNCRLCFRKCWKCKIRESVYARARKSRILPVVALLLLQNGALPTTESIAYYLRNGNDEVVHASINRLKKKGKTDEINQVSNTACSLGRLDFLEKLIAAGADVTQRFLLSAVLSRRESVVRGVIDLMKKKGTWNPDQDCIQQYLKLSITLHCTAIAEVLHAERIAVFGTAADSSNRHRLQTWRSRTKMDKFVDTIQFKQCPYLSFQSSVDEMQRESEWDPHHPRVEEAMVILLSYGKLREINFLLQERQGASITSKCLIGAVKSGFVHIVQYVIDKLNEHNQWNATSSDAQDAFALAIKLWYMKPEVIDKLVAAGVDVEPTSLHSLAATEGSPAEKLETAKLIIDVLKKKHKWNPSHPDTIQALNSLNLKPT